MSEVAWQQRYWSRPGASCVHLCPKIMCQNNEAEIELVLMFYHDAKNDVMKLMLLMLQQLWMAVDVSSLLLFMMMMILD